MLKPTEKQFTKEIEKLGTFVFKFPTLQDEIAADNITQRLLAGNQNPTIGVNNTAVMIGTLKVALVEAPKDFDIDEIYSYPELESVYKSFVETVSSFRGESAFAKREGVEGSSAGGSEGA